MLLQVCMLSETFHSTYFDPFFPLNTLRHNCDSSCPQHMGDSRVFLLSKIRYSKSFLETVWSGSELKKTKRTAPPTVTPHPSEQKAHILADRQVVSLQSRPDGKPLEFRPIKWPHTCRSTFRCYIVSVWVTAILLAESFQGNLFHFRTQFIFIFFTCNRFISSFFFLGLSIKRKCWIISICLNLLVFSGSLRTVLTQPLMVWN